MLILSKKKYSIICSNIYNISLEITEKLNKIISTQGFKIIDDKKKIRFCIFSSLYCYYFFELLLKEKYKFNDNSVFIVLHSLISELISNISDVTFEETFKIYITIKNLLNQISIDNEYVENIVINYLVMSIDFQEEIDSSFILVIYRQFSYILEDMYKII